MQQELGQPSVQILKETAAQAKENNLPAAKLAHFDSQFTWRSAACSAAMGEVAVDMLGSRFHQL